MKKDQVPQDKSNFTDLFYAVDENGEYTTAKSSGWEPKTIALQNAMEEVNYRIEQSRKRVLEGKASPIEYYMEKNRMDVSILSGYVGLWKWRVKRHLKPGVFKKLSDKTLKKYADVFEVELSELKNFKNGN